MHSFKQHIQEAFKSKRFKQNISSDMAGKIIEGNVVIEGKHESVADVRDLRGYTVNGHADIAEVSDLQGSPSIVRGELFITNGSFTSLSEAPKEVGGDFMLRRCQGIRDLKGSPHTNGRFTLLDNYNLKSLDGIQDIIYDTLEIHNSPLIRTLQGGPRVVSGDFMLRRCQGIRDLKGSPHTNGRFTLLDNYNLKSLDGIQDIIYDTLEIHNSPLIRTLQGGPRVVNGGVLLYGSGLSTVEGLPTRVGGSFIVGYDEVILNKYKINPLTVQEIRGVCACKDIRVNIY